nr:hypothetical protein [Tanacetum cinerariifolium]
GATGRLRWWGNRGRSRGSWLWRWYCWSRVAVVVLMVSRLGGDGSSGCGDSGGAWRKVA